MSRAALTACTVLAGALLFGAPPARAQLYKCIQDGRTVYQQEKCPDSARQSTVRPPDAVVEKPLDPKAAAEKAEQQATSEVDGLVEVIAGYSVCVEKVSGFGARYSDVYEGWKTRNAAAFSRFGSNPTAARKLEQRLQAERAKTFADDAEGLAARANACGRVIATIQPPRQ
jgi:hypothetical protein